MKRQKPTPNTMRKNAPASSAVFILMRIMLCFLCSTAVVQAQRVNWWIGNGGGSATRAMGIATLWQQGAITNGDILMIGSTNGPGVRNATWSSGGQRLDNAGAASGTYSAAFSNYPVSIVITNCDGYSIITTGLTNKLTLNASGIFQDASVTNTGATSTANPGVNRFYHYFELSANSQIINNSTNTVLNIRADASSANAGGNFCLDNKGYTLTVGGAGRMTFSAAGSTDPGGAIRGSGGVTKTGTGIVSLLAANTYSGPTAVSAGRLELSTLSAGGGSITVADSASLSVGLGVSNSIAAVGKIFCIPSLSLTNSSQAAGTANTNLVIDLRTSGNPTNPIIYATNLTAVGPNPIYVTITGSGLAVGTIPLIGYDTYTASGSGSLATNSLPGGITGYLTNNTTAKQWQLVVQQVAGLVWVGKTNAGLVGAWDLSTTNWYSATIAGQTAFANGQSVEFNETAFTNLVTLTTNVQPFLISVTNNSVTYTFTNNGNASNQINGTAQVLKSGPGTLVLGMTNSYTGFTTIRQGTLIPAVANALSYRSYLTNQAVLDLNGLSQTVGNLYGSGVVTNSTATPVTLTLAGVNGGDGGNFTGVIDEGTSGVITVNKNSGQTTFSGANKYSGGTYIYAGNSLLRQLILGGNNVLGTGPVIWTVAGTLTADASPRSLTNALQFTSSLVPTLGAAGAGLLTCSGPIDQGTAGNPEIAAESAVILTGTFNSSGGFATKSGSGALRLKDSTNSFLNNTELKINGGSLILDNAQVTLNLQSVRIWSTSNATAGLVITNGGSLIIPAAGKGLQIGYFNAAASTNATNIAQVQGQLTTAGKITLGYSGGGQRAELNVGTNSTVTTTKIDSSTNVVTSVVNLDGATLVTQDGVANSFIEGITSVYIHGGGVTITATTTNDTHIPQALLGGTGSGGLTKTGAATVQLDGTNTYTGTTTISSGDLGGDGVLAGPLVISNGGTLVPGGGGDLHSFTVNSDVTFDSGSHATFELNTTNDVSAATNDLLSVSGTLSITNSTLEVQNDGPALVLGNRFVLFNKAAAGFTNVILPTLDAGLAWQNNLAVDGSIQVNSEVVSSPVLGVSQTGSQLTFSWTGSFKLQSQTNTLSAGLGTNWLDYPGGSTSPVSVTVDPANPAVFFRLSQ